MPRALTNNLGMTRAGLAGALLALLVAHRCGAQSNNFIILLRPETPTVHLHDPIWVTVQITNVSGVAQEAWFGPRFLYDFRIVENETESVVASNPWNEFGYDSYMGREYMVAPSRVATARPCCSTEVAKAGEQLLLSNLHRDRGR